MLQALQPKDKKYRISAGPFGENPVSAFSTRLSGNMSLSYGDTRNVLRNRKDFLTELSIDYQRLVCAKQVHANTARYVHEADAGKGALSYEDSIPDTDAILTDKKNVALAIFTADCLSVFLYDAKNHAIALAHAGWRSSEKNILAQTVRLMREKFDTEARDLYAGFGPSIRACCYEVGRGFTDFFAPEFLIEREKRYYLDLPGVNKKQLLVLGVKEENIFDTRICTACRSEEFFSYRKEGTSTGRMMSVIMLK